MSAKSQVKPLVFAKTKRAAALQLGAARRAAVVAALNQIGTATPIYRLAEAPSVKALNIPLAKLKSLVYNMQHTGVLDSTSISDAKANVGYFPAGGKISRELAASGKTTKAEAKATRVPKLGKAGAAANLKVDIVKATGRVRLEINGLVIEIGVI